MNNNQLPLEQILQVPDLTNLSKKLKYLLRKETQFISELRKGLENQDIDTIYVNCVHIKVTNLEILETLKNDINDELKEWIINLDIINEKILSMLR